MTSVSTIKKIQVGKQLSFVDYKEIKSTAINQFGLAYIYGKHHDSELHTEIPKLLTNFTKIM